MKTKLCKVRVRPQRVDVLASTTSGDELLLAMKLFSRVWGGRFCQLIPVTPGDLGPALERLQLSRPEYVLTLGLDAASLQVDISEACQPRDIRSLSADDVSKFNYGRERHITVGHVLRHLVSGGAADYLRQGPFRFVHCPDESPWKVFASAMFGVPGHVGQETVPHEVTHLNADTGFSDLVRLSASMVERDERGWLNLGAFGLSPHVFNSTYALPHVVIVRDVVADVSLFWNLRSATDPNFPAWLLPIPEMALSEPDLYPAVRDWLLAFAEHGFTTDFCRVLSTSVSEEELSAVASGLKAAFNKTSVHHIDIIHAPSLPVVVASEREQQLVVERRGQRLSFRPPAPRLLPEDARRSWVLDFVKDATTLRAVEEMALPHRTTAVTVLNAPCPPTFPMDLYARLGIGPDCVNYRCSSTEMAGFGVPTAEEVLTECLREHDVIGVQDEKQAAYHPVIHLFGGLRKAADAMTGKRRLILRTLLNGPLGIDKIKGTCRLGDGTLAELGDSANLKSLLKSYDPVSRRVAHRRFQNTKVGPASAKVESLLEHWTDLRVLHRRWRIGPCRECQYAGFVARLDLSKPIRCPRCGSKPTVPPSVPLGYEVNPVVASAIREGLIPVTLAAQFLKGLTREGFLWLPGFKYRWGERKGDIDIVASCDGHLVFMECKDLTEAKAESDTWKAVVLQFKELVEVAEHCRAAIVGLAVLRDEIPPEVEQEIQTALPEHLSLLLLNNKDLEQGRREIPHPGRASSRWLSLGDVLSQPRSVKQAKAPVGRRVATTPFGQFIIGRDAEPPEQEDAG